LGVGFIDHLQVVTTNNYSAIAISTLYKMMLVFPTRSVFTSSYLVTASNNCFSSASGLMFSLKGGSLQSQIQSQCYFMAGGLPPISSSWRQIP
jgi:hypothetical protein